MGSAKSNVDFCRMALITEEYFEDVAHIQLAQLNRLRQEAKLLDMSIIVSGVSIIFNMPLF